MRKIVEEALRHADLDLTDVLQAGNGEQGVAILAEAAVASQSFDLILCDVHMPVLDGLGFLHEVSRLNLAPGVPVVMITADADDPYLMSAIAAGAQGYIAKPFTLRQVQAALSSLPPLAGSRLPSPAVSSIGGAP